MVQEPRYKGWRRGGAQPRPRPVGQRPERTEEGTPVFALDLREVIPLEFPFHDQTSVTTPGVRVQLPDVPCRGATLRARTTNTGNVFLGGNLVNAANGYIMTPGAALDLAIDNLSRLYIDAAVANEGISWLVLA